MIRPGDGDLHGNTFPLRNWSIFFVSEATAPVPTAGSAFVGLQPQATPAGTGRPLQKEMVATANAEIYWRYADQYPWTGGE